MTIRNILTGSILVALAAARVQGAEMPAVKLTQEAADIKVEIDGKPFTTYYFNDGHGQAVRAAVFLPGAGGGWHADDFGSVDRRAEQIHAQGRSSASSVDVDRAGRSEGLPGRISRWITGRLWTRWQPPPHQTHVKFDKVEGDTIQEQVTWDGLDGKPVLNETRTFRFLTLADGSRAVDFTSAFTPTSAAVTFGETKEAGLCAVRVNPQISSKPTITNASRPDWREGNLGQAGQVVR